MKTSNRIVLVGRRKSALEAARKLGLQVDLWVESPLRELDVELHVAPFDQVDAVGLVNLHMDARPRAVVALTEKAVVPAARLRERLKVAGIDTECATRCHDKLVMKHRFAEHDIPCARVELIDDRTSAEALVDAFGLPVVVKQRTSSGSRGMVVCRTLEELEDKLTRGWLAEQFVDGIEMSLESYVADGEVIFCNPTQYLVPGWANVVPAPIDDGVREQLKSLNQRVIDVFGIQRGMVHLELFLTPNGPVVGELACRPPGGYVMDLLERAYGFNPWEFMLRVEMGERPRFPEQPQSAAGVWVLHPGAGRCEAVEGITEAREVPGVDDVVCRVEAGSLVNERVGLGQDVGRILASGRDPKAVARALEDAHQRIDFTMA